MSVPFQTILLSVFDKVQSNTQRRSQDMKVFEILSYIHTNTNRVLSIANCFSLRSPLGMKRQRCYQNGGMKVGEIRAFLPYKSVGPMMCYTSHFYTTTTVRRT